MCFFILNRYRSCRHDQVGPFAAFCTTAKARSSLNRLNSTQTTPQEKHDDIHDSFSDFFAGTDDNPEPTYCGQPLFSPKYLNDSGSDDVYGGVCGNCVEMERLINEGNLKSDFQCSSQDVIDDPVSWLGRGNQLNWQTPSKPPENVFSQRHSVNSNSGNHHINIPLPPQESFHHPLFKSQKHTQRKPVPLDQQLFPPQVLSQSYPTTPVAASNRSSENSTNKPTIVQQMLHDYPQRARSVVENTTTNQTPGPSRESRLS